MSQEHRAKPTDESPNDHQLVVVTERLPGKRPTDYDIDLSEGESYLARFYRCRNCGQERNRPADFRERCEATPPSLLSDGGYSIDDGRTRRALTEEMVVHFGSAGTSYEVESQSGKQYEVDVLQKTCTCLDHVKRKSECKHMRRVIFEILAGRVPTPEGQFEKRC